MFFPTLQGPVKLQLLKPSTQACAGYELQGLVLGEGLGRYLRLLEEFLGMIVEDRTTKGLSAHDVDATTDFMSTFQGSGNGGQVAWPLFATEHERVTSALFGR